MKFSSDEESYRFGVYLDNLEDIEKHNSKADKNYEQGANQFTHLTPEEFAQSYLNTIGERSYMNQKSLEVERDMQVL